jgi:hypothetical protein
MIPTSALPPTESPESVANITPRDPLMSGTMIPMATSLMPYARSPRARRATVTPRSIMKRVRAP